MGWGGWSPPQGAGGGGGGAGTLAATLALGNTSGANDLIMDSGQAVVIGGATTSGVRLAIDTGVLAVREGDDSAYGSLAAKDVYVAGGTLRVNDNTVLQLGTSTNDPAVEWQTTQTNPGLVFNLGDTSNYVQIVDNTHRNVDYGHANQTDPTLFIHANSVATDEWLSLQHNGTDGVLTLGSGDLIVSTDGSTADGTLSLGTVNATSFTGSSNSVRVVDQNGGEFRVGTNGTYGFTSGTDVTSTAIDTFLCRGGASGALSLGTTEDATDGTLSLDSLIAGTSVVAGPSVIPGHAGSFVSSDGVNVAAFAPASGGATATFQGLPVLNGDMRTVISLVDDTAFAAGVGPSFSLVGRISAAPAYQVFGHVKGLKENGTSGNAAGSLVLGTTNSVGAGTPTDRWRITSDGHFLSEADNTYDLGASGATRPRTLYLGTALNVGNGITPSTANGDLVLGDGTRYMTFDASTGALELGGPAASVTQLTVTADYNATVSGIANNDDSNPFANSQWYAGVPTGGVSLRATSAGWTNSGILRSNSGHAYSSSGMTGGMVVGTEGTNDLHFYTNSIETGRLTHEGGLTIGDVGTLGDAVEGELYVGDGSSRFHVDPSSGLVSMTDATAAVTTLPGFGAASDAGRAALMASTANATGANGPLVIMVHKRGTHDSFTATQSGDVLGEMIFQGANTTSSTNTGASIEALAAETWTSGSTATYLGFWTQHTGSNVEREQMRLSAEGGLTVGDVSGLGNASRGDILAGNGTNSIQWDASSNELVISGGWVSTLTDGGQAIGFGTTSQRGIHVGSGSPESVVTASRGSLYLRIDGGTGTSLYVKETTDGSNTGWVAK